MMKNKILPYIILHFAVFILSFSTICAKFAADQDFMSPNFIALYAGVILALAVYAFIWQQILKNIPLTIAFANKAAILLWSLVWGVALFQENISVNILIGIFIVFVGVILVTSNTSKPEKTRPEKKSNG